MTKRFVIAFSDSIFLYFDLVAAANFVSRVVDLDASLSRSARFVAVALFIHDDPEGSKLASISVVEPFTATFHVARKH